MRPLTLSRAGSSRELPAYVVLPRTQAVARVSERDTGSVFPRGDMLPLPVEFVVTVFAPAATFASAITFVHDVVADAERAAAATTHEGEYDIAGLDGYDVHTDGTEVLLTLRFTATGPFPIRIVRAQRGDVSVTRHTATVTVTTDAIGPSAVTYGGQLVTYDSDVVTFTSA